MLLEEHCESSYRFLCASFIFSDKTIKYWKNETIRRCKAIEKSEAYEKYLNWNRSKNEIAVFTTYAYADFLLPKKFDCIFFYDDPENYINVDYELAQSIWEGYYPIENIENGHKHLCVLSFKDVVPDIFKTMYVETGKYAFRPDKKGKVLGLCQMFDIQNIIYRHNQESAFNRRSG